MAFENINVSSLKNALNSCKNSINNNISKELKNSVMNSDVWHCDARNNLRGSLNELENLYNKLTDKINHYLSIANEIEKYQQLVAQNKKLDSEYDTLSGRLYRTETYDENYYNEETKRWEPKDPKPTRRVKDTNVENQMNAIKNEIGNNQNSMESISNRIANSL